MWVRQGVVTLQSHIASQKEALAATKVRVTKLGGLGAISARGARSATKPVETAFCPPRTRNFKLLTYRRT